jgi:predicted CopG family antitoxin
MVTTISVSEEVKKELAKLKIELGYPSMDSLIKDAIVEMRNRKFEDASRLFKEKLKEKGLTIEDIQKEGTRIRREVYREWFKK